MGSAVRKVLGFLGLAPKITTPPSAKPNHVISDSTTKLVGAPLSTIYGERVHVKGNIVKKFVSKNKKYMEVVVALCWGPVDIDLDSIRINEKRPHYINGAGNRNGLKDVGYIKNLKVWAYDGTLGQTPQHELDYGLNRTAYLFITARANSLLSGISTVDVIVSRRNLFSNDAYSLQYNTPIPAVVASAFPNGVPSSNPVAAALDYMLNKDYGAARPESMFKDYATWINGVNHCAELVDAANSNVVSWAYVTGFALTQNNHHISKHRDSGAWDAAAISKGNIADLGGNLKFTADAPVTASITEGELSCSLVPNPNYDPNSQLTDINGENPAYVENCTDTTATRVYVDNIIVGMAYSRTSNDFTDIRFGIHLRGDGNFEVWENGDRIKNSSASTLPDPYPLYRIGENHGDSEYAPDSDFVHGTYIEDDVFDIVVAEDGTVTYLKNDTLFYTSSNIKNQTAYIFTTAWREGASVRLQTWDAEEFEPRWALSIEAGTEENDEHIDVLNNILSVAGAQPFSYNGTLKVFYPHVTASSAEIDRSTFIPSSSVITDIMDVPNVIEVEYKDDTADGEKRTVVWENPTGISEWGEIRKEIKMHGIPSRTQASRYASLMGRRAASERIGLDGIVDPRFIGNEPGDVITVTAGYEDSTWFDRKEFWIDAVVPENREGDVEFQMIEYGGDDLFDDSSGTVLDANDAIIVQDASTALPAPDQTPENPAFGTVTAVAGSIDMSPTRNFYIDVNWEIPSQPDYMHDKFLIYRRTNTSNAWVHVNTVSGRASSWRDETADPVRNSYLYAVISETTFGVEGELPDTGHVWISALALDVPGPITNLSVELLTDSRAQIDWTHPVVPIDFKDYLVYVYRQSESIDDTSPVNGGVTTNTVKTWASATPGDYYITVRVRDTFGNVSDGVTVPFTMPEPNNVTSFYVDERDSEGYRFAWSIDGNRNHNLQGFMIRYNMNGSTNWNASSPLHQGTIGDAVWATDYLSPGSLTAICRAVDTYGNLSEQFGVITLNVTNEATNNVLETFDFKVGDFTLPSDNWPGTLEGGSIDGGEPTKWQVMVGADEAGYWKRNDSLLARGVWYTVVNGEEDEWKFVCQDDSANEVSFRTYNNDLVGDTHVGYVSTGDEGVVQGVGVPFRKVMDNAEVYQNLLVAPNTPLATSSQGLFYFKDSGDALYGSDDNRLFFDRDFTTMTYTTPTIKPSASGTMKVFADIDASSYLIEYRTPFPSLMYPLGDNDPMYSSDDVEVFTEFGWSTWSGHIEATTNEYQFRVTTDKAAPQGRINEFRVTIDVDDKVEYLNDIDVGASGSRATPSTSFNKITSVHLTIQDDGGSSVSGRVIDKNSDLGPLVQVFDANDNPTTGVVNVILVGY